MLATLLLGCNLPTLLLPVSAPEPGLVETLVVRTASVILTQTAAAPTATNTPTPTPQPTNTPTPWPTTVTLTPFLGAASGDLECDLLTKSLRDGAHVAPREHFDVGWKVRNTGRLTWEPGIVYFAYLRGTRMDRADRYDLPELVFPDGKVTLSASLTAPRKDGTYTTVWSLRRGANFFCLLDLTINVP